MKKLLLLLLCVPFICVGQTWDMTDYDRYNIVGWGEDGLVAYTLFYSNYDEPHGIEDDYYADYSLNIHDLKTDEILYTEYIEDDIYDNLILDEYNIVVDTSNELHHSDFYKEGHYFLGIEQNYTLEFFEDVVYDIHEDCSCPELNGNISTSTLHVFINYNSGRKQVGSLESEKCYSGFGFKGYYNSPFEDRILLVFSSTESLNGEMRDTKFEFIGCSLNPSTFK